MLIRNATLADGRRRDVRIDGERIDAVGRRLSTAGDERNGIQAGKEDERDGTRADGEVLDATGKLLLPGMIDVHVHAREPGFPHKETWETLGRSAAAGGVTTVVDQPNTDPPTIDGEAFDLKATLAAGSLVDYGINGGVTPAWNPEELLERPLFALGEVFLADSTGEMGIDGELFERAVREASEREVAVTVHAEDASLFDESVFPRSTDASGEEGGVTSGNATEKRTATEGGRERSEREAADAWSAFRPAEAEVEAIERACAVGDRLDTQLHIAHTSTPAGIDRANERGATCEVTPHHLFLSRSDTEELGAYGRMNPPLRSETRRQGVFERVANGTVDVIATDHAPHTRAEKERGIWDAPSGVPGVETALPLLLAAARRGELSYERGRDLTATNPASVFDLARKGRIEAGKDADLVLVDPGTTKEIRGEDLHSKAGWTPFEGFEGVFPEWTMVRGRIVYERTTDDGDGDGGERFGEESGENVRR